MRLWVLVQFFFPFLFFCVGLKVGSSFHVLGETIHITSEYLSQEPNTTKEKAKVLFDDLKAKRQLTLDKDEQN